MILTNEEKISIIAQHQRNASYNKFNLQMSLVEENALTTKNQSAIDSLNAQILEIDAKLGALAAELEGLE